MPTVAFTPAQREITLRTILIGMGLAIILAASNTYLALKIGILTSASIPAAVIGMGILRLLRRPGILENNMIQTAASAGEAIAGGIVYTIPALIIIHYWTHFGYLHNFLIALIGGLLGVLFSVPLRRVLLNEPQLRFPEGLAITKVLQMGETHGQQLRYLLKGGLLGAVIEFLQSGLQVVASQMQGFFAIGKTLFGFGSGFSATLIGAGYLIGLNVGVSLLIGAVVGWLVLVPYFSGVLHLAAGSGSHAAMAQQLWGNNVRFVGIGSMLTAGVWTLLTLLKPIGAGIASSIRAFMQPAQGGIRVRDKDIPLGYVAAGVCVALVLCYFVFRDILPVTALTLSGHLNMGLMLSSLLFVLVIGFIFAAICGYFSGMVGVSASPGSSVVIGGLLIVAFALRTLLAHQGITLTHDIMLNASAIVIVLISMVTGIACITNDNIQDLKVGQLVGSTPWKQQCMLLLGVVAASAVVPLLMQLLFSVYGLGGVYPHAGMDPGKMLPAPVPSVLAAVTQAVFQHQLPLNMLGWGVGITVAFIILNLLLRGTRFRLSILGIAIGLYLPLSSSTPLFLGSLIAFWVQRASQRRASSATQAQRGIFTACGLVAGAALMDVVLAIPFAMSGNPNILKIMPDSWQSLAVVLGILSVCALAAVFYRDAVQKSEAR